MILSGGFSVAAQFSDDGGDTREFRKGIIYLSCVFTDLDRGLWLFVHSMLIKIASVARMGAGRYGICWKGHFMCIIGCFAGSFIVVLYLGSGTDYEEDDQDKHKA